MKKAWRGLRYVEIAAKTAVISGFNPQAGKKYLLENLKSLPGVPMKMAQLLGFSDIHVNPMPSWQVKQIIETYNPALSEELVELEDVGQVASLGQVHRGLLKDGKEVAIKVQFPGLEEEIDLQIDLILKSVALSPVRAFDLDLEAYRTDLKKRYLSELDYRQEAKNQIQLKSKFSALEFVRVPEVHEKLSSQRVLVQSYEDGFSLDSLKSLPSKKRQLAGYCIIEVLMASLFTFFKLHGDPHPGNWRIRFDNDGNPSLLLYDFGSVLELGPAHASSLATIIENLRSDHGYNPMDGFVALGFTTEKLSSIAHKLPALSREIFSPLIEERPWSPKEWQVGSQFEKILGADKWWFRTAGPPWFLQLMRVVYVTSAALVQLDGKYQFSEVYNHYKKINPKLNLNVQFPSSNVSSMACSTHSDKMASVLNVLVSESGTEIVNLQLPVKLVDDLDSVIPENVLQKISDMGFDIPIKQRAITSGYLQQILFETGIGDRNYKVWLS